MIFAVIILVIGAGFIPVSASFNVNVPTSKVSEEEFNLYSFIDKPKLAIEDFSGGLGLTFVIKNEGTTEISDITLDIKAVGDLITILSPKHLDISSIGVGESNTIKIRVLGLGFGEPIDYNRIVVTANAPSIGTMERTVVVSILGPLLDVITVFINDEGSYEGYTLFTPEYFTDTYLINNSGDIVNKWESKFIQGTSCGLLENGNLIRTCMAKVNPTFIIGGTTGRMEMFNWEGDLIWEFDYSNDEHCLHHGFEVLPNGNILMISWEIKSAAEAITAGRNPLTMPAMALWPCYIIEVEPTLPRGGNIVWEWHVWDHLIQNYDSTKDNYGALIDHPELIDINSGLPEGFLDWNHINSVDYNEEFDQILLSSHAQGEIWIIDHNTTTEEAAGHTGGRYGKGGDLLYRWGNPQNYGAGTASDQYFFGQHDARWIESGCPGEGNILVFNNGFLRPYTSYSSVDEIVPPVDEDGNYYLEPGSAYGPERPVWTYTATPRTDFYAAITSGAQRLPNGNTLICDGPGGVFFEVTPDKELVWRYVNLFPDPVIFNAVTYIDRYPLDYGGVGDTSFNIESSTAESVNAIAAPSTSQSQQSTPSNQLLNN
jgi:hypothetical protein